MISNFKAASVLGLQKYSAADCKLQEYGTAGFRDKAKELSHVLYRMGLLAVLRSKAKIGQVIGLMITASHNPEEDNGVKLCDPQGDMLNKDWELLATKLVNSKNEDLAEVLSTIVTSNNIDYDIPAHVYLAKDTRSSSPYLASAAVDGIGILDGQVKDFGLLTTPQLHYVVCCKNNETYGEPSEEGYYKKLSKAFETLRNSQKGTTLSAKYEPEVYVDGANGVGALKMKEMLPCIKSLRVHILNDGSTGVLNFKCGADFVKVDQKPPEGIEILNEKRYASFDGDADRLIYFYTDKNGVFHLLDGDKIATLIAKYLKDLVEKSELKLDMKVVQTAYANGSSTDYIENVLQIPHSCVPTGVKHLHAEAKTCDIGIYFEANGHGTVIFSQRAKEEIKQIASKGNEIQKQMAEKLLQTINLINETVGDAISDLLLVEVILSDLDWSVDDWNAMYTDYPNKQMKVKVPDRQAIVTTNAERTCVKPAGLQASIDSAVGQYSRARAFVRPSGTEDIVRVYAEAETQEDAVALAEKVCSLVKKFTSD
ncbi:phosphoacetylglucosamine mutase-like [Uloborus diversus]|uniref:phosphoacetylglucosamine mutase-like n=1 Tax=Uloborus diversus TaxID=327109 RepID=UPI00240A8A50|nr:phosphoacetylglucosamine mutase-like [Uloborus diversus]